MDDSECHHYGQLVIGSFIRTTCPLHASCLMQSFLVKHQITQVTDPLCSPDLMPCDFWLFPKLKSSLKGRRFQTDNEIQGNMTGQLMVTGSTVWGPKVPTLRGTEVSLFYVHICTVFLLSCVFFNKCLCFSYYMAGYLLDSPHIIAKCFITYNQFSCSLNIQVWMLVISRLRDCMLIIFKL